MYPENARTSRQAPTVSYPVPYWRNAVALCPLGCWSGFGRAEEGDAAELNEGL